MRFSRLVFGQSFDNQRCGAVKCILYIWVVSMQVLKNIGTKFF